MAADDSGAFVPSKEYAPGGAAHAAAALVEILG